MKNKNWNRLLNIAVIVLAGIIIGALIGIFSIRNGSSKAEILPGLTFVSQTSNRSARSYNSEADTFNYGSDKPLSDFLNTKLSLEENTLWAYTFDDDGNYVLKKNVNANDPSKGGEVFTITAENASSVMQALIEYLDESRFSSVQNMVTYVNDYYNFNISLRDNNNYLKSDSQLLTELVVKLQRWSIDDDLNAQSIIDYANLNRTIDALRLDSLTKYVDRGNALYYANAFKLFVWASNHDFNPSQTYGEDLFSNIAVSTDNIQSSLELVAKFIYQTYSSKIISESYNKEAMLADIGNTASNTYYLNPTSILRLIDSKILESDAVTLPILTIRAAEEYLNTFFQFDTFDNSVSGDERPAIFYEKVTPYANFTAIYNYFENSGINLTQFNMTGLLNWIVNVKHENETDKGKILNQMKSDQTIKNMEAKYAGNNKMWYYKSADEYWKNESVKADITTLQDFINERVLENYLREHFDYGTDENNTKNAISVGYALYKGTDSQLRTGLQNYLTEVVYKSDTEHKPATNALQTLISAVKYLSQYADIDDSITNTRDLIIQIYDHTITKKLDQENGSEQIGSSNPEKGTNGTENVVLKINNIANYVAKEIDAQYDVSNLNNADKLRYFVMSQNILDQNAETEGRQAFNYPYSEGNISEFVQKMFNYQELSSSNYPLQEHINNAVFLYEQDIQVVKGIFGISLGSTDVTTILNSINTFTVNINGIASSSSNTNIMNQELSQTILQYFGLFGATQAASSENVFAFLPYIARNADTDLTIPTSSQPIHAAFDYVLSVDVTNISQIDSLPTIITYLKDYYNSEINSFAIANGFNSPDNINEIYSLLPLLEDTLHLLDKESRINMLYGSSDNDAINYLNSTKYRLHGTGFNFTSITENLPSTAVDQIISKINDLEANGNQLNRIIAYDFVSNDNYIPTLQQRVTLYCGFNFNDTNAEDSVIDVFNLFKVVKLCDLTLSVDTSRLSYGQLLQAVINALKTLDEDPTFSGTSLDDVITEANKRILTKIDPSQFTDKNDIAAMIKAIFDYKTNGDLSDDQEDNDIVLGYIKKIMLRFILPKSVSAQQNTVAPYLQSRGLMYIAGPVVAAKSGDSLEYNSDTYDNPDLINHINLYKELTSRGYNLGPIQTETSGTTVVLSTDLITKMVGYTLLNETKGQYAPNSIAPFENGDYLLLQNAAAKLRLQNGLTATTEDIQNIYLQFGKRQDQVIPTGSNEILLTSLNVTATLNGQDLALDDNYVQNGITFGNTNISTNQYWYMYLDLHNLKGRRHGADTQVYAINDPYGHYVFTFNYSAATETSQPTGVTYIFEFYVVDQDAYIGSYPTFDTTTTQSSNQNSYNEVIQFNNNRTTENYSTFTYNPSLYNLTFTHVRDNQVNDVYTTSFVENKDSTGVITSYANIYRNGTLQNINCPETTLYYYYDANNSHTVTKETQAQSNGQILVAEVTYGLASLTGDAANAANGGMIDGQDYTYKITLRQQDYQPGAANKVFDTLDNTNKTNGAYYPSIDVMLPEFGEYDFEVRYVLCYKPNITDTTYTYSPIDNTTNTFAFNFQKYYTATGDPQEASANHEPSLLYDRYFNLINFGFKAEFNKANQDNQKYELRNYSDGQRADITYITRYVDEYKAAKDEAQTSALNNLTKALTAVGITNTETITNMLASENEATIYVAIATSLKDKLPKTNMPPITFNNWGSLLLNESNNQPLSWYYIGDYTNTPITTTRPFTKDTWLPRDNTNGLYVVYLNYEKEQTGRTSLTGNQVFAFIIDNLAPDYTISGSTSYYTNQSVSVDWAEPGFFEAPIYADYKVRNLGTNTPWSTDSINYTKNSSLENNGVYRITLHFGNNAYKYIEFAIDKMPIDNIKLQLLQEITATVDNQTNTYYTPLQQDGQDVIYDGTSAIYTNSPFTLTYNAKLSGAKITTNIYKINFKQNNDAGTVLGENLYITNGYELDTANRLNRGIYDYTAQQAMFAETQIGEDTIQNILKTTLIPNYKDYNSGVYMFEIVDEAGNSAYFFVIYDLTVPTAKIDPEFEDALHRSADPVTITFGQGKAIKYTLSDDGGTMIQSLNQTLTNWNTINTQSGDQKYIVIPHNTAVTFTYDDNETTTVQTSALKQQLTATTKFGSADYNTSQWNSRETRYEFTFDSVSNTKNDSNYYYTNFVEINFDNSEVLLYANNDQEANIENSVVNIDSLRLKFNTAASDSEGNSNYTVQSITYRYYPLNPGQAINNDYSGVTDWNNTRYTALYPFVNTASDVTLYSQDAENTNGSKQGDEWISNAINTVNNVTLEGMYVFTRTYVAELPADSKDSKTRQYVVYFDRNHVIEIDNADVSLPNYNYSAGYNIHIELGTEDVYNFDANRILSYIDREQPISLFTTNRFPVKLFIPQDKYNTRNVLEEHGVSNEATNAIAKFNNTKFGLNINLVYGVTNITIPNGDDAIRPYTDFAKSGVYTITIQDSTSEVPNNVSSSTARTFTFEIQNVAPAGLFEIKYDEAQTAPLDTKTNSKTQFVNTNSNSLLFSFEDQTSEFMANIDYKNIAVELNGARIYEINNGQLVVSNKYAAYYAVPVSPSNTYTIEGNQLIDNITGETYVYDPATGHLPMFVLQEGDYVLQDLTRQYNGVRFRFYIQIFDVYDQTGTSSIIDYHTAQTDGTYSVRLQYIGNQAEFADNFSATYSIIIDRARPVKNLNNLIATEIKNAISHMFDNKDLINVSVSGYIGSQVVTVTYDNNPVNNDEITALINQMLTLYADSNNVYSYIYYLPSDFTFVKDEADNDMETDRIYAQSITNEIVNFRPYITPDNPDSNFVISDYLLFEYVDGKLQLNDLEAGFYQIVERDQAGNYTSYIIYVNNDAARPELTVNYKLYSNNQLVNPNGTAISANTNISNGYDLILNALGDDHTSNNKYVTVKITNLDDGSMVSHLYLVVNDSDLDDINALLDSYNVETNIRGYKVEIDVDYRYVNYNITYTIAGNRFEAVFNATSDNADWFTVTFPEDIDTLQTITAIRAERYNQNTGLWVIIDYDSRGIPFNLNSGRTFTFNRGSLYRFTITDNFTRSFIQAYSLGLPDVISVFSRDGNNNYIPDVHNGENRYNFRFYTHDPIVLALQDSLYKYEVDLYAFRNDQNGQSSYEIVTLSPTLKSIVMYDGLAIPFLGLNGSQYISIGQPNESGMRNIIFSNINGYDLLKYVVKLSKESTGETFTYEIVFVNILDQIELTDADNNVVHSTRFMETVTAHWSNLSINETVFEVSANIVKSTYTEDNRQEIETIYPDSNSYTIDSIGNYYIYLNCHALNLNNHTSATAYSYVGGTSIMFEVYTLDNGIETRLNSSPYSDYIVLNGNLDNNAKQYNNETFPVYTYFALNDYFISTLTPDAGTPRYLTVRANAEDKLTVTLVYSKLGDNIYVGSDLHVTLGDPTIDADQTNFNIYRIHSNPDQTSSVYEDFVIVYFIDAATNFAHVEINNNTNPLNSARYTNDQLVVTWDSTFGSKNIIALEYYYNDAYVGRIYSTSTKPQVTLKTAGKYTLYFKDLAGNLEYFRDAQIDGSYDHIELYLINNVTILVNGEDPIPNLITNNPVRLQITNTNLYDQQVQVSAILNGQETSATLTNGYYEFSRPGYYEVTLSTFARATNQEEATEIITKYNFVIYDANSAILSFSLPTTYNFRIVKLAKGNEDITYQTTNTPNTIWISSADGVYGAGQYTFTLSYTDETTNITRTFDFGVWVNDELPSLVCSITWGTSTTKEIYIYFNPALIYQMVGNCTIQLSTGQTYTINANSVNSRQTITLSAYAEHQIRILSPEGKLIASYSVTRKRPLNTAAIITISVSAAVVVALAIVFIVLRRKIKFR